MLVTGIILIGIVFYAIWGSCEKSIRTAKMVLVVAAVVPVV